MKNLFRLDHPIWKLMSLLSDFLLLTLLWLLFSLPIVTIGPSVVALNHTLIKITQQSGQGTIREFLNAFKSNFKTSLFVGIIVLSAYIILLFNIRVLLYQTDPALIFIFFVSILLLILLSFNCFYLFPMMATTRNSVKENLVLSFYLSIKHLKWSVFLFVSHATMVFITVYIAPYLSFFIIGGMAYVNITVYNFIIKNSFVNSTTIF